MSPFLRLRALFSQIAGLFDSESRGARFDEETRFHLEMATEKLVAAGISPAEARRRAVLEFGGHARLSEEARDVYRSRPLHDFSRDIRYAFRALRQSPGFAAAAVATLAIGIGANTAIFSAVDGVMLKPLPFVDNDRIVSLYQTDRKTGNDRGGVAPANFVDWQRRAKTFDGVAVAEPFGFSYSTPEGEEQLPAWNVTADFFRILGVRPHLGRVFSSDDFRPATARPVILTYDSWRSRFGADPRIVGRTIRIERAPATIIGVLPRDFSYLADGVREIFTPKVLDSMEVALRYTGWYSAVARLAPGVTRAQAQADMDRVASQLAREYPRTNANTGVRVVPIRESIVGDVSRVLVLLLGAVVLLLLIACVNVASLLLARTLRRSREFAVRAALGAARARIIRQVLAESFALAVVGGSAGVAFAFWSLGAIRALSPRLPRLDEVRIDERALAFALGAVLLTTLLFGLVPALRATRIELYDEIRGGSRTASRGTRRLRGIFVTTQVTLAVVLLIGAGLLVRSFVSVVQQERGYRPENVLSAMMFFWDWNDTPAKRRDFARRLEERARALPGVLAAGGVTSLPLSAAIGADRGKFTVPGRAIVPGEEPTAHITAVTPGAFEALRIPLMAGRTFGARDDAGANAVAIVNATMAQRYWPGEDVVGKRLSIGFYGKPVDREIVGVVADVHQAALDKPVEPAVYLPHSQAPSGAMQLLVRTSRDPQLAAGDVKRMVRELNPQLPIAQLITLDALASNSLRPRRFMMILFAAFSATALLLAIVGLYGVISQATLERQRELGVRIALGARRTDILGIVMRDGVASAAIGVAAGAAISAGAGRLLGRMLWGVTPLDLPTYAAVFAIVLITAMIASYLPARRATRIDPLKAIRSS